MNQPFPEDAACNNPPELGEDPEYLEWLDHMDNMIRMGDALSGTKEEYFFGEEDDA
jgi:hypothetical protein